MSIQVTMPRLSDTMQQGTIVKWNVKEGQAIKSGDVIADIETDKATMELQSYDDGVVAALSVPAGQNVPVGTLIMLIAGRGEDVAAVKASGGNAQNTPAAKAVAQASTATSVALAVPVAVAVNGHAGRAKGSDASVAHASQAQTHSNGTSGHGRIFISPLAKKIAGESNVDLSSIQGTGPGGRIVRKDIEAALSSAIPAPRIAAPAVPALSASGTKLGGKVVALSNMRRVIATRLVESKQTIPHYQVSMDVDMAPLSRLRTELNEQLSVQGVKLSVNDFIVRACALAMHQHPYVNSRWVPTPGQESIELISDVNIGVAIALGEEKGGGLVVATVRNADQIGLRQISAQSKALSEKARGKGLSPQEMSDSTFTISNLGMFGVSHFTAIINPPNAAILAVGAAIEKPVVKDGQVVAGVIMTMTMSSDHRIVDGAMAAAYLKTVKTLLEKPATLLV
jgi:pyruvate dehydrogenase E2 component (dihydrolipoamide acetyltransferase)